jgi:hypothetical protein
MKSTELALAKPQTPQLDESEDELNLSPTVGGSAMRKQLISQFSNQLSSQSSIQPNSQAAEPLGTGKK